MSKRNSPLRSASSIPNQTHEPDATAELSSASRGHKSDQRLLPRVKRLSRWQRERHIRIARTRALRKRNRIKHRDSERDFAPRDHIIAPKRFDLGPSTGWEVRNFLDELGVAVGQERRVKLDFR